MKLLIADDNADMRKMLKSICVNVFNSILECDDGDSAVRIYREEKPDWILMDIKMNKLDGISATMKIKSIHPEAKIIIVSQYNDENVVDAAKNSGAIEFVNKEDLSKILEIINEN